jgi:transposase-like protein
MRTLEFLSLFECPVCAHKLKIGEKKLAQVKCSKCNYNFIVDTGMEANKPATHTEETGFFSKFKSIFQ